MAEETNESHRHVKEAAVVIPLCRRDDDLCLVFVRRGEIGIHGGQLAFPGGKREPQDASLRETALREASEEMGIAPDKIHIVASLPSIDTSTTGFRIFPFLARIDPPPTWRPQEGEIAEIIEVRVRELALPEAQGEEVMHFPTWPEPRSVPHYKIGSYRLWGVTYRILQPLLARLLRDA